MDNGQCQHFLPDLHLQIPEYLHLTFLGALKDFWYTTQLLWSYEQFLVE